MSCASQTRASLESAALSGTGEEAAGRGGGFGGMPCAARGRTGVKKITTVCRSLRIPRFKISKAVLHFPGDEYLAHAPLIRRQLGQGHLAHQQRSKANVLHTNMRGVRNLPHAAKDGCNL